MKSNVIQLSALTRWAVYLYSNGTHAFFTSAPVGLDGKAPLDAAAAKFESGMGASWECQVVALDAAISRFREQADRDGTIELYEDGIGEPELHAFFGDGRPGGENMTAREIVAALAAFAAPARSER